MAEQQQPEALAQIAAILQQLQQQNQQAQQQAAAGPAQPQYALTPGRANPGAFIDCKAFEDNSGALELARTPKLRPRTKHINIKYHHFRDHVRSGKIKIYPVKSEDQLADVLTKPLPQNLFLRFRKLILRF